LNVQFSSLGLNVTTTTSRRRYV